MTARLLCGAAALAAAALLDLSSTGKVLAVDKSGVSANTISLPSGPGSIEGLGESFEPSLNSGTAKYGFKVAIPPGVSGSGPSLAPRYEGGSGNGPLGFGWRFGVPSIQRQTDKGIPRYEDVANGVDDDSDGRIDEDDERDTFVTDAGEELVLTSGGHFFCENEGAFVRYRKVPGACAGAPATPCMADSECDEGGGCSGFYWEADYPNGSTVSFGASPAARIVDAETGRIFEWLAERSIDRNGNVSEYFYTPYPGEENRNQKYLAEIRYGPGASDSERSWPAFHFVSFVYESRSDWFEDGRPGFLVRTGMRLCEIIVGTQGVDLDVGLTGDFNADGTGDYLVRKYVFSYQGHPHWSLLTKVQQTGADGESTLPPMQLAYTIADPPESISATDEIVGGANEPVTVVDNEAVDLIDLDGDSFPDILRTDPFGGPHVAYLNRGETAHPGGGRELGWTAGIDVGGDARAGAVNLASTTGANAHLADMNGDGLADFAYRSAGGDTYYFANTGRLAWGDRVLMNVDPSESSPPSPFGASDVKTADIDFDKRIDVIQSVSVGIGADYRIWLNLGGGTYARSQTVTQDAGVMLSDPGVKIADFNGDRVPDIVQTRPTGLRVSAGLGYGNFAPVRIVDLPDWTFDSAQVEKATLEDVTGDGLVDLVVERATAGQLWYWINRGNYTVEQRRILTGMPTAFGVSTEVRWADMNGNGTTDLVYADSANLPRLRTVDIGRLIGSEPSPLLLTRISNGIGAVTEIEYASSSAEYQRDRDAGRRWRTRLAFPVDVIVRRTVSFGLDLDGVAGEDHYVTEYRYHDGYYDGREKEFRGFGEVEVIERGDSSAPTLVTRHRFHTGAPDGVNNDGDGATDEFTDAGGAEEESLKGKPLESRRETCSGNCSGSGEPVGEIFDHVFHRWEVRRLYAPSVCSGDPAVGCCADTECQAAGLGTCQSADPAHPGRLPATSCVAGKGVQFAVETGTRTAVVERGAGARRDLFVGLDYDDYGNKTVERNWGIVAAADLPPFGCTLVSGNCSDNLDLACSTDTDCLGSCERRSLTDANQPCAGDPFAFTNPAEPVDQRFTTMTYTNDADDWLLRYECESEVAACLGCGSAGDAGGATVETRTRQYYDGQGLCQVEKGNMTRREQWLDTENRWIQRLTSQFDAFGNIVEAKDARGNRRTLEYDAQFRTYPVTERVHLDGYANAPLPHGQTGTFSTGPYTLNMTAEYHEGFGVMTRSTSWGIIGAKGPESQYRYDSFGRLIATVAPGDSLAAPTAHYEYHLADPDAADVLGRSLNSVVSKRRESAGGGTVDAYAYVDGVGHKLGTKAEGDSTGEWIYSGATGFSLRGTESRKWLEYVTGSPAYEAPASPQARIESTYDAAGRAIRVSSPATGAPGEPGGGAYTQTIYTPLSTDTYDENDTAGITSNDYMTHEKDGLDRLIRVVERSSTNCGAHCGEYHTRYSYDARGNLTRILDAQSNQKQVEYDSLGRKTFMNDPNRGHLFWTYDDTDNVIRTVDAKGQQNVFTYDRANRLLTEDYLDGGSLSPDVSYLYDHAATAVDMGDGIVATARFTAGYPSSVYDLSGEEHTSYDERRRPEWDLKRVRDPRRPNVVVSYATRMAYDSMDRATHLVYPDGDGLEYLYGRRGLLTGIRGSGPAGQEIVRDVQYRPSGQIASVEYGSGVQTTYDYDARQRMTDLLTMGAGSTRGQELLHFGYQFDPVSNITAITDERSDAAVPLDSPRRNSQEFSYDGLHRLTAYTLPQGPTPGAHINYLYDKLGNMTSALSDIDHNDERTGLSLTNLGAMTYGGGTGSSGRIGREANDPPGPHALTAAKGRSYPYDANGNMTDIDGMAAHWDHKDRLVAVERPGMSARYVYDYTDRRVTKAVTAPATSGGGQGGGTAVTTYVNRFFELREGSQPTKYVWMGDTRVAQIEATLDNTATRVQRLSLFQGWNLLTLAVTPGTDPLGIGGPGSPIAEAYRWRENQTPEYEPVTGAIAIAPGDILWLRVTRDVEIPVVGSYERVLNHELPVGADAGYVPWRWLEPTAGDAWAVHDSSLWFFDSARRADPRWRFFPPRGVTDIPNDFPKWLGPGAVFYWKNHPPEASVSPVGPQEHIRFYHQDHLGSTAATTDASGLLHEELAYYPYGAPRNRHENPSGVLRQAYSYTQKEIDFETHLANFEARFLSPAIARFLSVDPKLQVVPSGVPQSLLAYGYCSGNPIIMIDPSGGDDKPASPGLLDRLQEAGKGAFVTGIDFAHSVVSESVSVSVKMKMKEIMAEGLAKSAKEGADKLGRFLKAKSDQEFNLRGLTKMAPTVNALGLVSALDDLKESLKKKDVEGIVVNGADVLVSAAGTGASVLIVAGVTGPAVVVTAEVTAVAGAGIGAYSATRAGLNIAFDRTGPRSEDIPGPSQGEQYELPKGGRMD